MIHERVDLPIHAVRFSLGNIIHAILESPPEGPYPKVGRVLGNGVEVRDKTIKIDNFDPKIKSFGEKVIVFTQGRRP